MIGTIRISQLPPANTLTGNETVIVNQDGDTRRTTAGDVVGLVTYVSSAGIATVAEGLTGTPDISVSSLNVSGVSTFGTVDIAGNLVLGPNSAPAVKSDTTGVTGADQITNMMSLTQAEYDAIVSPDANTFYVITA